MELRELRKPFASEKIKWRVGATTNDKKRGLALAYVDSRVVMERLDNVCGVENWQKKYSFGNNGEIICAIGIKIEDNWVWKSGGAGQTDFEAIKGGLSDAFKRAAVSWGIGRYLYELPTIWADIKKQGKNYVIKDEPQLPAEFLPQEENYVDQIRKLYQKNPSASGEIITTFLTEIGIKDAKDLSNVTRLNLNQAKKLIEKLKDVQKPAS